MTVAVVGPRERTRLALDVNFPEPILSALKAFVVDLELVPVRRIAPGLVELEDRDLVIALRQEGYGWLVTNNYKMLRNPHELAAILKTRIKVFAIEGTGQDPLRATGAVLLDLPAAVKKATPAGNGQIFWSRPRSPNPREPWEVFSESAKHRHQPPADLYEDVKVSNDELAEPWRAKVRQ